MSETTVVVSVIAAVLGPTGLGFWWFGLKRDRREDHADQIATLEAQVGVVSSLIHQTSELQDQVAALYDRWQSATTSVDAAREEAAAAREEAAKARAEAALASRDVHALEAFLARLGALFRPIIDWIDAGAVPPPPEIPDDLRQIAYRSPGDVPLP